MSYIAKAIAGYLSAALLVPLSVIGVTGEMPFSSALEMIMFALISGGITFFSVYLTPNKK